jgi:hypothetical protein
MGSAHVRPFAVALLGLSPHLVACASTVDGTTATGPDAAVALDVPPGFNPDGLDPFRPVEAGVISTDAGATDAGPSPFADATVFDQRYGTLYVGSNSGGLSDTTYASATFRYVPYPDDPRCGQRSAGSWDLIVCTNDGPGPADPHPRTFPNAGVITIAGGLTPVTLRLQGSGQYSPYYNNQPQFTGPRAVRVRAPGTREVPAIDLALEVPPPLVVTSPGADPDVVVARDRDLVIEWVPSAAREVWVVLSLNDDSAGDARSYRASVQAYGNAGRAVIPARALAELPPVPPGQTMLSVLPYNVTATRVGSWPLTTTVVGQGSRYRVTLR